MSSHVGSSYREAMLRIVAVCMTVWLAACTTQPAEDPVAREQALAKNDVWHAAKLRGVAFRAVGQEPGWLLEITTGEQIVVVTNYGQNRQTFPYVEPQEYPDERRSVFQLDSDSRVLIEGTSCTDTMSGESFEVTVTVTLDGKEFRGCGRALY